MKKFLLLALMPCLPVLLGAQLPTAGLIAYYPFSGNANDYGPNGLNGTVVGATLDQDRFGHANCAYKFNGTSNYISIPTTGIIGLNIYSYSTWIKPLGYSSTGGMPWCSGENGPYCQGLTFQQAGTLFGGSYNVGSNPVESYSQSGPMGLGNWIHVVVTRDNTTIKLYVNGVLTGLAAGSGISNQSADYGSVSPFRVLFGVRTNLTAYFEGLIDDIRIYTTALTQTDVTALYHERCFDPAPVTSYSACTGSSLLLTAIVPGEPASWFTSLTGAAVATGSVYSPGTYPAAGTYTYYAAASNCTNTSYVPILVTVIPPPAILVSSSSPTACIGQGYTLTASGASSYLWNTGTVTNTLASVASAPAQYTITGVDNSGCSDTVTVSQAVDRCEGIISQNFGDTPWMLYPNPNNGSFTLKYNSVTTAATGFIIEDAQGRIIKEYTPDPAGGSLEIKEQGMPGGLYFWKLADGVRIISSGKLIIN